MKAMRAWARRAGARTRLRAARAAETFRVRSACAGGDALLLQLVAAAVVGVAVAQIAFFAASHCAARSERELSCAEDEESAAVLAYTIAAHTIDHARGLPQLVRALAAHATDLASCALRAGGPQHIVVFFGEAVTAREVERATARTVERLRSQKDAPAVRLHVLPREESTEIGISAVSIQLALIQHAARVCQHCTHFVMLRGCDYPLVSVQLLRALLPNRSSLFEIDDPSTWSRYNSRRSARIFLDPATAVFPEWPGLPKALERYEAAADSPAQEPAVASNSQAYASVAEPNVSASTVKRGRLIVAGRRPHGKAHCEGNCTLQLPRCSRIAVLSRELATCALYSSRATQLLVALSTTALPSEHFFCSLAWHFRALCSDLFESSRLVEQKPDDSKIFSIEDGERVLLAVLPTGGLAQASRTDNIDYVELSLQVNAMNRSLPALFVADLATEAFEGREPRDFIDLTANGVAPADSAEKTRTREWHKAVLSSVHASIRLYAQDVPSNGSITALADVALSSLRQRILRTAAVLAF